ncbi:MAG: hypothetical protein KDA57_12150 [Planctomycetales bacterium]|nr:hypothetical protein [Planctomycetales bacterium]
MNVTYACPACHGGVRADFDAQTRELCCDHCGAKLAVAEDAVEGNRVCRCLVCPSADLFIRKDFPQRVGVALVGVGIVGSSIAWYYSNLTWTFGLLFATALADVLLYSFVGNALMCYRCDSQYRGVAEMEAHGNFDLEIHEKYRQLEARIKASKPQETAS